MRHDVDQTRVPVFSLAEQQSVATWSRQLPRIWLARSELCNSALCDRNRSISRF